MYLYEQQEGLYCPYMRDRGLAMSFYGMKNVNVSRNKGGATTTTKITEVNYAHYPRVFLLIDVHYYT